MMRGRGVYSEENGITLRRWFFCKITFSSTLTHIRLTIIKELEKEKAFSLADTNTS